MAENKMCEITSSQKIYRDHIMENEILRLAILDTCIIVFRN